MEKLRTRLAPSPTGALHLGNARTFLVNWAMARHRGWEIVLRIEDLDGPRIKPGADRQAIEILRWLGIDWDQGPYYQRQDLSRYHAAMQRLAGEGWIYLCRCTRSQIASAQSAPHGDEREPRYPGTCRPTEHAPCKYEPNGEAVAWRLRVPDELIGFTDGFHGPQSLNLHQSVGDFIVATKAGLPAYQLAVVVDDAPQGVTHVVRGDDLLGSTPRQILLYRRLHLGPPPDYYHLPLVVGPDGRRLAKRHGDTRLTHYRQRGVAAERVIGLLAYWSGLGERKPMTALEFADRFDLSKLSKENVVMTEENERWLLGGDAK